MEQLDFLVDLLVVFAVTGVAVFLFQLLRLPSVVGLLVAGVLMGPTGFSLVDEVERVRLLAEIGVVVLLFTVGLEFSLSKLWAMWPVMFRVGMPQVLLCGLVTFLATYWYMGGLGPAVFCGMLVAMSSTAIVLKVLTDRGELDSPQGRVAIAVLLLQDLLVVVCMLSTPLLAAQGGDVKSLLVSLAVGNGMVVLILLAGKFLVPHLLYLVVQTRNRELFLILIVLLCLGTAAATAAVGLSLALGAFLAGLALAESDYAHQTLAEVLPFRDTLASLFFVSVGMLLDLRFVAENWLLIAVTVPAIFALKFLAGALPTLLLGYPQRIAVLSGVALAQVGEFSFVLAGRGRELGLLRSDDYQTFLAAAVITIALTPFLIAGSPKLAEWLGRFPIGRRETEEPDARVVERNHVIIIGYGVNGRNVARVLRDVDIPYVVLEMNPDTVRQGRARGEPLFFGDSTRPALLEHLGIHEAQVLVVAISDPASARRTVQMGRQLNPGVHIIIRTRYVAEVEELQRLGANEIIPEEFETSMEIFARVLRRYEVPRNIILDLSERIRLDHYDVLRDPDTPVQRVTLPFNILQRVETESCLIKEDSTAIGKSIGELRIRNATGATVVAVRRDQQLFLNPGPDQVLKVGDIVVLIGDRHQVDRAVFLLDSTLEQPEPKSSSTSSSGEREPSGT
ncbi:MAG: cation:proton antiporter [Gemmataceae bacterium]